jgi:hypothetical protein
MDIAWFIFSSKTRGKEPDPPSGGYKASSYMSPNAGGFFFGGGGCGVSANQYSCAHGAQINFGDLTPHLTYAQGKGKKKFIKNSARI